MVLNLLCCNISNLLKYEVIIYYEKVKSEYRSEPLLMFTILDYMYLRYADVLLMHAEASMESGDNGAAENSLNLVRQRAGLPNYDPTSSVIANYKETSLLNLDPLTASIYHERRVELGLENTRFYDLVRWGVAEAVLHDFNAYGKGNYVEGCGNLLPIPDNDVTVSDGLILQNPCY